GLPHRPPAGSHLGATRGASLAYRGRTLGEGRTMRAGTGALLVGLGLAGFAAPGTADPWERGFQVVGKPTVRVHADDAQVVVRTWDQPRVRARVETTGARIGPGEVTVTAEQRGDEIEIVEREPRFRLSFL